MSTEHLNCLIRLIHWCLSLTSEKELFNSLVLSQIKWISKSLRLGFGMCVVRVGVSVIVSVCDVDANIMHFG
jgi:hypothetical protein